MKKLLLSIVALSMAIFSTAQQRTEAEAAAIAKAFMQNNGYEFNITKSTAPNKVRAKKAGDITPYYIFNDTQNGGFVIVGGQEAMSDILAYSNEDCFDVNDIPPAAAEWLNVYSQCAIAAADEPEKSKAEKRASLKAQFSQRQNVAPLLGEIKYNQGAPYNKLCPVLTTSSGKGTALTGCTQTAQAMIMRYWKWPLRPKGNKSYTFNYYYSGSQTKQMTLSVDYDSEAPYEWDKILPRYESEGHSSYSSEQANAIARVMYHCGVANDAEYGLSVTNAAINYNGMVKYFGYSSDIVVDSYLYYKEKTNGDSDFRAMLIGEITDGRPILAGGWSADKTGSHYYVVDGYDMNSKFHFNLGWNGSSNGYYEVTPVPQAPYSYDMYIIKHIHPEGRLTPTSPVRRVVVEAALGSFNDQTSNITNTLKSLTNESYYSESLICILTKDTEEDAESYLAGLSSVKGVLVDRCDTVTGRISMSAVKPAYNERVNTDAPANIDIDAMFSSASSMKVSVSSHFVKDIENADYRYKFVYTEDNITISGKAYNGIARGTYPDNLGFENSVPATVKKDTEYIFEQEIPIPETLINVDNGKLIVMMIDAKSGEIVNANTLDLKQVNAWREKQKPSFYYNGELAASGKTVETYFFDEEKSRMAFPVCINNPLYEPMEVDVYAEFIELGDNAEVQLGEIPEAADIKYSLKPFSVDSTLMLYLNIDDKYVDSESSIKLTLMYKNRTIAYQTVNFKFYRFISGINAYTLRQAGTLSQMVSPAAKDTMSIITLGGRICGNDIIYMRDSLKLKTIDMSQAKIVAGPGAYYSNYLTEEDVFGSRLFVGMQASTVILPAEVTSVGNYAFNQNKELSKVVLNNALTNIGNNAFAGCKALQRITLPASLTKIGRQAFKDCPIVCVICEGETPASIDSKTFDTDVPANATLVVPTEAAIATYKADKQWSTFGKIISYEQYLTNIAPATEDDAVAVKDGKIVVAEGAEVAIYTFAGKQIAKGSAGEYSLPAGNYIVKVGNKAIKIRL